MKTKVNAKRDLDLSVAKAIAETAGAFRAEIRILCSGKGANAKSLMGIITLSYKRGAEITLIAEGRDEKEAAEAIAKII